jgi:hypothetical protein
VIGSPASAAITLRRAERTLTVGASTVLDVLRIDDGLDPRPARWRLERIEAHGWHLRDTDGDDERRVTVGADGRPQLFDEMVWPLEG